MILFVKYIFPSVLNLKKYISSSYIEFQKIYCSSCIEHFFKSYQLFMHNYENHSSIKIKYDLKNCLDVNSMEVISYHRHKYPKLNFNSRYCHHLGPEKRMLRLFD